MHPFNGEVWKQFNSVHPWFSMKHGMYLGCLYPACDVRVFLEDKHNLVQRTGQRRFIVT